MNDDLMHAMNIYVGLLDPEEQAVIRKLHSQLLAVLATTDNKQLAKTALALITAEHLNIVTQPN